MKTAATKYLCAMAACGLALVARSARGEEAELGEVVVTATRNATNISDVPQSTSVISREEIANGPDRTLPEIVQRATGVEVIRNGPAGSVSLAQIRGSESQQVLILIDGRRINDAQSGSFDLSDLPLARDDIERIEVLRGGASALYGTDAVGGVINIITRAPSREPHAQASASWGDFRTREYTFTHRWKPGAFSYGLSVSREESLGFRPNSDFGAWVLGGEVGYDLTPRSALGLSVRTILKEVGTPGRRDNPDPDDRQKDDLTQLDLTYRTTVGSSLNLGIRGYQNFYSLTFDQGAEGPDAGPAVRHRNYATGGEIQATAALGGSQLLTGGGEVVRDRVSSTTLGVRDATRGALFLQDEIELARLLLVTLGLRYDQHSVFGEQFDPRVGLLLRLPREVRLRASFARSYRAPTLNDLYWPEDAFSAGNPGLKPESARSYELGAEKRFGRLAFVRVAGFHRDTDNLIRWAEGADGKWRPSNVASATIWGAEAEVTLHPVKGLAIPLNYAFLHPWDESTGEAIPKKPKHVVNAAVEYTIGGGEGERLGLVSSVRGRYVQFYLDEASRLNREYLVFDARVAMKIAIHRGLKGEVFVTLNNALNRDYEIAEGYPMPPRSFSGGVSLAF